jgi:hypothetical protein
VDIDLSPGGHAVEVDGGIAGAALKITARSTMTHCE